MSQFLNPNGDFAQVDQRENQRNANDNAGGKDANSEREESSSSSSMQTDSNQDEAEAEGMAEIDQDAPGATDETRVRNMSLLIEKIGSG